MFGDAYYFPHTSTGGAESPESGISGGGDDCRHPLRDGAGEPDLERRAGADLALHADLTAVCLDDRLDDREAEPGTGNAVRSCGAEETVERCRRSSGEIPTPVSLTRSTSDSPSGRTQTLTVPPGGVNLSAFESRFSITSAIRCSS